MMMKLMMRNQKDMWLIQQESKKKEVVMVIYGCIRCVVYVCSILHR